MRRMCLRGAMVVIALATIVAISGAATGVAAKGGKNGIDPTLVQKLKDNARGSVSISTKKSTNYGSFVRAGAHGDLLPSSKADPEQKAAEFLGTYGGLIGATDDGSKLVQTGTSVDGLGSTVAYQQEYKGIPVFGAEVLAHLDGAGNLTAVNGVAVPDVNIDTTPALSSGDAASRAIDAVLASPPEDDQTGEPAKLTRDELSSELTTLYIYRTGLIRGVEGTTQLAYEVIVSNGGSVRDAVYVAANTGKILNRYSLGENAMYRRIFEQAFSPSTMVWQEGDPFPGLLNLDQRNIHNGTQDAYNFYSNAFGRDSYDGQGAIMNIVNNDPRINCPNANWNGTTTNYCNGVTADDVVAHEWSHAYTEYTDHLIYQWQPGALNESYSDIWGETIDQINGTGTDSPNTVRTVGACSTHTTPIPILVINSPTPGTCQAGAAQFGAPLTATGTTGDVVYAGRGCDPAYQAGVPLDPYLANVAGKVAMLDRGVCSFIFKVKKAQAMGAIAVIIANNTTGVITMGGNDPTVTIPSLSISQANGNVIKTYLTAGQTVNATLKVKGGAAPRQDSFRWLMGEDATSFNAAAGAGNHAIRDMWDPTCLSNPGKVSDAEYSCGTSDNGGVHNNSGVPNHGYALLVDGGTYNGHTVQGIGLTKAAAIYWRAESVYQTKITDFADHAVSLQAACQDLIGQPINNLSTGAPAGVSAQAISATDCAQIPEMAAAVELKQEPTQCGFGPLLNPNTPDLCANQKNPPVIYEQGFENGLGDFTVSNAASTAPHAGAGWPGTNFVVASSASLPGGRPGNAAFAEDMDGGCGGARDVSGVMHLTSPAIHLPNAGILSPRITFDQYVATERDFDGGNVKLSVNGGPFTVVPASAFSFNPYDTTFATAAAGNTSPLAGEPAFSGTDGGRVTGSWGQSQIDLTKMGVNPGDTIQLQFDYGQDGCGSVIGWYVDDVTVKVCNTKKDTAKKD